MAYNYEGAIGAGAKPSDVINYLSTQTGYNAQGALQAGANPNDVLKYMSTLSNKIAPPKTSMLGNIVSDIQKRGANAEGDITSTEGNSDNPLVQGAADVAHGVSAAGEAGGAVMDTGIDVAKALYEKLVPDSIKNNISNYKPGASPIRDAIASELSKANDELGIRLNDFVNAHPELGSVLQSALKTGQGAGNVAGGVLTGEGAAEGLQKGVTAAKSGIETAKNTVSDVKDAITGKVNDISTPDQNDLQKIHETISPKLTVKEARLAETQGRLYKGSEPTLFKGEGETKIAASAQQANSARTIQRLIPDAASMDEPTLYTALKEKIGQTAEALKPAMEATPIQEDTVEKITNDWEALKKTQKENPYAPKDIKVKQIQDDFESRLKKSNNENMNDLWETRKTYDDSVPPNIKSANDLSSDALKAQKEMWLQNRKILTDAINDTANGMGKTSQQAFSDMRDMYEGQNGILSKAKVSTKVEPSKLKQFSNSTTGKVVKHVVKGAVGAATGKSLGGTIGEVGGGIIGLGF